ncbi:MAG: hypothetical protein ACAH83_16010 [Alphaproteobacteria bacterium]
MKFIPDFLKRKPKAEPAPAAAPEEKSDSLFDLENMKQKLSDLMDSKNRSRTTNTILVITGAGALVAGVAADIAFLGGVGTVTVLSCLYSDLRNTQNIDKISKELSDIEQKMETMKASQQQAPDYAPALSAVKSSIEDFQAKAKRVPPEVAEGLAKLKTQVEALEDKIAPANDDGAPRAPSSHRQL